MANNKVGLNYYNIDTDRYQDIRIKRLKKDMGCDGLAIYDYILCEIYRVKGCFIVWDESTAFDVAEYFQVKETLVNEVVKYCGAVGLFNEVLLKRGIITSLSIQKRYFDICKRAKRSNIQIPEEINLTEELDIIPEELDIIPEESPDITVSLQGSKVKESKVKKSKEQEKLTSKKEKLSTKQPIITSPADAAEGKRFDFIDSLLAIFSEEYKNSRGNEYDFKMAIGKERHMMGKILQRYKSKEENKSKNTEETKTGMRKWFKVFLGIDGKSLNGKWHHSNMSPSHIVDNYNSLITIIKGSKNGTTGNLPSYDKCKEALKRDGL